MQPSSTRNRVLAVTASAVLTAAAVLGVRAAIDSPARGAARAGGGVASAPGAADQQALDAAADRITPVLDADPVYTGVLVDAAHHRLVGYGAGHFDAARWSRARALMPPGSTLAFAVSRLSDQQVRELSGYVSARQRSGLRASVWGLTALDGPFQVTLRPGTVLSAADRAYFDSFGPGDVVTRTGEASGV